MRKCPVPIFQSFKNFSAILLQLTFPCDLICEPEEWLQNKEAWLHQIQTTTDKLL